MSVAEFNDRYAEPSPLAATPVTVRAWREGDDLALLEVFGDPQDPLHHQDRTLLRASSDTPWVRSLVVEDDGVPVGAATVSVSGLHPQRLWFYAEIVPTLRRKGIGRALFAEMQRVAGDGAAFKTRFGAESAAAKFAAAVGFAPIQTSRQVLVTPEALPAPALDESSQLQLEDLATGSVELSQLVQKFYAHTHQWDPTQISIGQAQQLLLAPATGASGAVVIRDTQVEKNLKQGLTNIAAFAISYANHDAAPVDDAAADITDVSDVLIGHNPDLTPAQAQHALGALLGMLVHRFPVRLELDEAMPELTAVVAPLIKDRRALVFHTGIIAATDG